MRFFALDLHISVIADLKDILKDHEVIEWSLSGHNWVFNRPTATPEIISQATWKNLTLEQLTAFRTKQDAFLRTFDGFLVGYVPAYAMIFEPQGKPILGSVCCRQDVPFCFTKTPAMREVLHTALRRMIANGQLRLAANNRGDADQFAMGTGLTIPLRPSICRQTQMSHSPTKGTFYAYSSAIPNHPLITRRQHGFQWSELAQYRGVIHIPQEISTMSLCEQQQSGIPLFVPSKRFLRELWSSGRSEWWSVNAYWGSQMPTELAPCSNVDFWIRRADFQDPENMPFVQTFDSMDDLLRQLVDFQDIHLEARREWIRGREARVVREWTDSLSAPLALEGVV